jgi:hypothetical protein
MQVWCSDTRARKGGLLCAQGQWASFWPHFPELLAGTGGGSSSLYFGWLALWFGL